MIETKTHRIIGKSVTGKTKKGQGSYDYITNTVKITGQGDKHLTRLEAKAFQLILQNNMTMTKDDITKHMYPDIHKGLVIDSRPVDQIMYKLQKKLDDFLVYTGERKKKIYVLEETL